jgi:hypothetical protein|tara:strand:- start:125 stop:253 length:129 start_codon:yes stop_codon:yes gene_type:complete
MNAGLDIQVKRKREVSLRNHQADLELSLKANNRTLLEMKNIE